MRTRLCVLSCFAVLGALGWAYVATTMSCPGCRMRGRGAKVRTDLHALRKSIDAYANARLRWPYALDELDAACSVDPSSPAPPLLDPWDNEYCFEWASDGGYLVTCFGADGIPGGFGDDADIVLTQAAR